MIIEMNLNTILEDVFYKKNIERKAKYKKLYFEPLLKGIVSNVNYFPEQGISQEEWEELKVFSTGEYFFSNDLIIGKTSDNNNYKYCYIDTFDRRKDSNSNRVNKIIRFIGTYLEIDLNKNFYCQLLLKSKKYSCYKAYTLCNNLEKFETENQELNSKYKCYTNNLQDAFYVLSPQIENIISKLAEEYKNKVSLYFYNKKIYLLLHDVYLFKTPCIFMTERSSVNYVIHAKEDMLQLLKIIKLFTK